VHIVSNLTNPLHSPFARFKRAHNVDGTIHRDCNRYETQHFLHRTALNTGLQHQHSGINGSVFLPAANILVRSKCKGCSGDKIIEEALFRCGIFELNVAPLRPITG
jgi:hypothetical protein